MNNIKDLRRRSRAGPPVRTKREREDVTLTNLWQRIRQFGVKSGMDPRLESEIGRLTLFGHLTASDFEAAQRFAHITGRWEILHAMPRRSAASPSYCMGRGGLDTALERPQEEIDEVNEAYRVMMAVIPVQPRFVRLIMESVCIDNEMCPQQHYEDLHRLLQRLAELWGLLK